MDVKSALRVLWKDSCSVFEYREYLRENKSAGHTEVAVVQNEPCKLSFETLKTVNQTETGAALFQAAKLFVDAGITVKPGSKIVVTRQDGSVFEFCQSGAAGVFTTHREIPLVPFEEYA